MVIILYSGTPGSGKSLHVAERIWWCLKMGRPVVGNFPIAIEKVRCKNPACYVYRDNDELTPAFLIAHAQKINEARGRVVEDSILLIIDECQLLFNSRDWGQKDRKDWLRFFTLHRHLGYQVILVCQFDRMLDRQIRSLIEYEYIHRKVSNYGWQGKLISLFGGGNLFVCVQAWYPLKQKVGSNFFRAKKMFYKLYDTYAMFGASPSLALPDASELSSAEDGVPEAGTLADGGAAPGDG